MSNSNVCQNCRHYAEKACRRYPPAVTILLIPAPLTKFMAPGQPAPLTPAPMSAWPPIDQPKTMTCGEFSSRFAVLG